MKYFALLIPIVSAVFAITDGSFIFRAGVSGSCAAIVLFLSCYGNGRSKLWVVAALLVSAIADWFMMHSGKVQIYFIYGIALFFIAHSGFIVYCLKNGRFNRWALLIISTSYLVFFFTTLLPAINQTILLIAVLAYLLVSCVSFAVAFGLKLPSFARWCFILGISFLIFSDTIIALNTFAGYSINNLILPTYFASHILITLALIKPKAEAQ